MLDPPYNRFGARMSLSYTFGTKGQSRINFGVGIGYSRRWNDFMGGANLSLNMYNGGPGTDQAVTGRNSFGGAVTLGLSGTFGEGEENERMSRINIFNSSTLSGIVNPFEKSLTIGTNFTYNTATGYNRVAGFAGKTGGFSIAINEDFSLFKNGGLLASGLDEGETGGGFIGYSFKHGGSLYLGTEIFTGKPLKYPKPSSDKYPGYVGQSASQQRYNVGRSFLIMENFPTIGSWRFDFSGNKQMFSQNGIHDILHYDRFRSTAVNSIQVTR